MAIGNKIKLIREKNNLTRQELAEKINVTDVTISRYENNKREPNIETLKKISQALNTNIDNLINDDNENINNSEHKSVFAKFNDQIDTVQLKRDIDKANSTELFFKSLGYDITLLSNEDDNCIFYINDVEYTSNQFDTLLKMLETCIHDVQEIVRNNNS